MHVAFHLVAHLDILRQRDRVAGLPATVMGQAERLCETWAEEGALAP